MNIITLFKKSILAPDGKESSTRISAYIMLSLIVLFSISFLSVFIYMMITKDITDKMIIVFGMLLTHHLTLLGINKYHENKQIKK